MAYMYTCTLIVEREAVITFVVRIYLKYTNIAMFLLHFTHMGIQF